MYCTCCRYVIGGVRKKMNVEWNTPSTIPAAKSLPPTPISVLPTNFRQFSTPNIGNEHRKIVPKGLNCENRTASTVLHNKASVLSNIVACKNAQATRSLLPGFAPTSINQSSFNFNILNSQFKENILNHSSISKASSFGDAIQSLAHNKLLKAILPAGNQIFIPSTTNGLKSSQSTPSVNNCNTNFSSSSKSITLTANQTNLLTLISSKSENRSVNSQDHGNENNSKIFCYWEDCKR